MRTGNLSTWLLRGTYPRLYVPIVLIIVLVSTVRYHYLVATETDEVRRHAATELRRAGDALLPSLATLPASDRQAQATLLSEGIASFGPGIHSLKWQVDNSLPPKPGRQTSNFLHRQSKCDRFAFIMNLHPIRLAQRNERTP